MVLAGIVVSYGISLENISYHDALGSNPENFATKLTAHHRKMKDLLLSPLPEASMVQRAADRTPIAITNETQEDKQLTSGSKNRGER